MLDWRDRGVVIDTGGPRPGRRRLDVMRPGDLHTHMYNDRQVEIVSRFNGQVQEYATEARRRGVLFDMDGVLVDSTRAVARVWSKWASERGFDPESWA